MDEKIERYLHHLDTQGLIQLILFMLSEDNNKGKELVVNMAKEWNKMYPKN